MKNKNLTRLTAILTVLTFVLSGCASTIPSRAREAIPLSLNPIYPVRVAFVPLSDNRPFSEKASPKHRTWSGGRGRTEYFGKLTDEGLTQSIAEYLTANRLFTEVKKVDLLMSDAAIKAQGYDLVLRGDIDQFTATFSVPILILGFAVVPNPFFFILPGITLVPIALWPKHITFDVVLSDLRLKDLRTSEEIWNGKIEIREEYNKMTVHVAPKWYLGEMVEKASKQLADKLWNAQLKL